MKKMISLLLVFTVLFSSIVLANGTVNEDVLFEGEIYIYDDNGLAYHIQEDEDGLTIIYGEDDLLDILSGYVHISRKFLSPDSFHITVQNQLNVVIKDVKVGYSVYNSRGVCNAARKIRNYGVLYPGATLRETYHYRDCARVSYSCSYYVNGSLNSLQDEFPR